MDDFLVEVNGSGVREALRVVLDVEFEQPDILLVEEPEVHLHPALEVAMMEHLKTISGAAQVFLTTHSTNFLDTGDMSNVYMVRANDATKVQHLDVSSAETELPKELGIRLSSVFMYDRLVFVEGHVDEQILRIFAQKLNLNLSQANVGFVVMGGARNFTHYAANATMSLLAKRRVKSFFVLDRDEHNQSGVDKLANQLGDDAMLHVLRRREIENYLIDTQALIEYISSRKKLEYTLTDEQIYTELSSVAEDLKALSVAKRVAADICGVRRARREKILESQERVDLENAVYEALVELESSIGEARESVQQIVSSTVSSIDTEWEERKFEIAPGDELIDGLMKKYGLRYRKNRDAVILAGLVAEDAVPGELRKLLTEICGYSVPAGGLQGTVHHMI